MSAKVDKAMQELLSSLTVEEIKELIIKIAEKFDLLGWLKVAEPVFSDWDNEEDAAYDNL